MDKPLKLYVADVSLRVYVVSRSEADAFVALIPIEGNPS